MKKHNKIYLRCLIILILLIILFFAIYSQFNTSQKIDYKVLFKGFITLNENNEFPQNKDYLVFTSEEDWEDFCCKYFNSFPSVVTEINNRSIDFEVENLIFIISLGPKHSYDSYWDIKHLLKKNKKFVVEYKNGRGTGDTIYVLNNEISNNLLTKHASVLLLSIKIKDVPMDDVNIYKK
nr:hypothetical protein [Sedimentibacter sp.]